MLNKVPMAILKVGNIFTIIGLLFLLCCEQPTKIDRTYKTSEKTIGINSYRENYVALKDSLSKWNEKLAHLSFIRNGDWELDSLICYNRSGTKLVACLECRCQKYADCNSDDLHFIYGVKIENKWYFFLGETVVLPRNFYQKDTRAPISFEKMHEIALKEIFSGYLTKSGEINEKFFSDHFENNGACPSCKTKEDYDKYYLWMVSNNWKAKPDYMYVPEKEVRLP
jgi:hypothetical protein